MLKLRAAWLAIFALFVALIGIAPAHAGDVTPTANSLSGQVWSKFTPTGTLPTTTNTTIATGQFNYSTNSTTIPVAVGPTFTVVRTAGPTGVNRTVAPGTYPPGSTPATGTGFPATAPEMHEFQGTGVVMRYTFSSALPTGSHVWAQDIDSNAIVRYQFYNCSGTLLNPSGFDYLLYSAANQPTRSFTSTQVTLTALSTSATEPLGAIIIRSSAVCRVDATVVASGSSTSQETFFSVPQPRITLTKALSSAGRVVSTDQFTVRIQSGATTLNSTTNSTTTGTGATVTGGTGTTGSTSVTVGGTYTLTELATNGLGNFAGSISCTNSKSGSATILPSGTGTSFSLTPVDTGDVISCTLTNSRKVDLAVTKTNVVTSVNASGTTSYTVTVTNSGPNSVTGAVLSDPAVIGLSKTSVTCSGTPGQCVTPPTVTQLQAGTFALPALASGATYQITINASVTATSGSVSNVATIAAPSGFQDTVTGNNSATDTDSVNRVSDLSITKTNGASGVSTGVATSYTITVTNGGPQSTTGAILSDPTATGLSVLSVVCSGTPGQCATPPSVPQLQSGSFALPALASGQTYQITVAANVTASSGTVSNVATIAAPSGTVDLSAGNNSATDTDNVVSASLSAPLCPASLASNNIIANGSFSTGTGPNWTGWTAAAIWTGSNQANVVSDTGSGNVTQSGLIGLIYGPSASERAVVQLSARWVNQGTAGNSISTSLGVFVAGVEYARITTPTGLGTTASVTYFNGASGNLASMFDNALTGWRIDLPAAVATSGSISFAFTGGGGGIADDFTIDDVAVYTCTPASLTITKSNALVVNGSNPAFVIPGNDMFYTIQVDNTAAGVTTNNTIFVYDALPTQLSFFNGDANGASAGTDPVIFTDNGSGLTWTLAADLAYSNSASPPTSFAACTYTPSAGYDPNVTYICANPKGVMAAKTSSPNPSFTLMLRARIK